MGPACQIQTWLRSLGFVEPLHLIKVLRTKPDFKSYGKGQSGIYELLKDKTSTAIDAAKKVRKNALESGQADPHTHVDELVEALQALARK